MKTLVALSLWLAAASLAFAAPDAAPKPTRLDTMKKLAGSWQAVDADGKPAAAVAYRVTSAGSAVEETLFPGTDHEMITMYTMDGDDLVLTHYCALGNQPHMKAEPEKDPHVLVFSYTSGGNMKSRDEQHMDALTLTIADDTHVRHDWTMWKDGKAVRHVVFDFVKKPD